MSKSLDEQIEERKQQAAERNIFEKAKLIVETLGEVVSKEEGELISYGRGDSKRTYTLTRVFNDASSSLVVRQEQQTERNFSDYGTRDNVSNNISISFEGNEIFQAGGYRNANGYTSGNIDAYAPGKWEKVLDTLHAAINEKITKEQTAAAEKIARQKAAEEAAKRKKWGLA